MRNVLILMMALSGVALLQGLFYVVRFVMDRQKEELRRRLKSVGDPTRSNLSLLRNRKLSNLPAIDTLLRMVSPTRAVESLIVQADLPFTVARLMAVSLLFCAVAVTVTVAARLGFAVGVVLGGVGLALPLLYVVAVRDRRATKLSEQLPDALDMMGRSLQAGHALISSFKLVASEMPTPVAVEFGRAFEEQSLGLPMERAIANMTLRTPKNPDLKIFAVSVIVQKDSGGNLIEILEKIAVTIRARYQFYGKLRSLTAEGRVSAYVLGSLPIVTGFFLYAVNPGYLVTLFSDEMGRKMLGYAVTSWVLGFVWMRRMARVEF